MNWFRKRRKTEKGDRFKVIGDSGAGDTCSSGKGFRWREMIGSIDRYGNAFFRFEMTLESLVHAFSKIPGDPDFPALVTDLDKNAFKQIKMSFNQAVQRHLPPMQLAAALGTQRIFHNIKGFTVVNITEDKTTRIGRVLWIGLNTQFEV